jgi:hypothetical protein
LRKQFCASLAQASFHTAWVNRVTLTARRSLPVFPRKRTSSEPVRMSAHAQISGAEQIDLLIYPREQVHSARTR